MRSKRYISSDLDTRAIRSAKTLVVVFPHPMFGSSHEHSTGGSSTRQMQELASTYGECPEDRELEVKIAV